MGALYFPLLRSNFQKKIAPEQIYVEADGEKVNLTQMLSRKVNIYQGDVNKNKVLITDGNGNVTVVNGVVMQQAERDKIKHLNPGTAIDLDNDRINVRIDPATLAIDSNNRITVIDPANTSHTHEIKDVNQLRQELDSRILIYQPDHPGKMLVVDQNTKNITFADLPDGVDITNILTEGVLIATINDTKVYAPNPGLALSMDAHNNVNVKYDNRTIVLDQQGRLSAVQFDPSTINSNIENIRTKLTEVERDTTKKVSKFFTSITELQIGEIGEYQGETNETFVRGYFYERGTGLPDEYETITIPAGSKKIIYTNKFDNTQKIVYAYEERSLNHEVTTMFQQKGKVWLLDETLHNKIVTNYQNQGYSGPNLIADNTSNLLYVSEDTIRNLFYNNYDAYIGTSGVRLFYNYLNSVRLSSGFVIDSSLPAIIGRVNDAIMVVEIPLSYGNGATPSTSISRRYVLLSDLDSVDWDFAKYVSKFQLYPILPTSGSWWYDNTKDVTINTVDNPVITTEDGTKYVLNWTDAMGQGTSTMYRTVSEDGNYERFIDINHLLCVFDSHPVTDGNNYWAEAIDLDLYFNHNVHFENTTQDITIRRKIQHYDENGFPIVNSGVSIIRVDTQPAAAFDTYSIETVSTTEGFLKTYQLVKTEPNGNKTYLPGKIDITKDLFLNAVERVTVNAQNPVEQNGDYLPHGDYFRFDFNTDNGISSQYIPIDTLRAEMTAGSHITIDGTEISATGFVAQYADLANALPGEKIVQYVGQPGNGLMTGYFYERDGNSWKQMDVQPHKTIAHTHLLSEIYDGEDSLATATELDITALAESSASGQPVPPDFNIQLTYATNEDIINIFPDLDNYTDDNDAVVASDSDIDGVFGN